MVNVNQVVKLNVVALNWMMKSIKKQKHIYNDRIIDHNKKYTHIHVAKVHQILIVSL